MYLEEIIGTVFTRAVLMSFDIVFYIYDFIVGIAVSLKAIILYLSIVVPWYVGLFLIIFLFYLFFKFFIKWR